MEQTIGVTLRVSGDNEEQMNSRIRAVINILESLHDVKFEEYEKV